MAEFSSKKRFSSSKNTIKKVSNPRGNDEQQQDKDDAEERQERMQSSATRTGAGFAATESAQASTEEAARTFAKPKEYTGNRTIYDDSKAKVAAKKKLFTGDKVVKDPYTGDTLVLTKKEAKVLYGDEWQKHLAESDHVISLKKIFEETKNRLWNTTDDIKDAANSDSNIQVTSRKYNNAKRDRTNQEYVNDEEYLKKKGVEVTDQGKRQAIKDSNKAAEKINDQLNEKAVKNVIHTGHEAAKAGAENAGITALTMSGIMNIVAVLKGEKDSKEAIEDTMKDTGAATVSGYVMSGSLTVVSHSLSNSSSKFVQGLVKSNVPGKVITAVIVTGDTLKRWGTGEITTQECLIELGDKGLNMATMGYGMAVGQAIIPIPIVGAAVGALVGSALTSEYYSNLINTLKTKELEHNERLKIIGECHSAAEQEKAYRRELEVYLEAYFKDYKDCFDSEISAMRFSWEVGDADGIIASANAITRKLGGNVYYDNMKEFREFLDSDTVDIL